MVAETILDDGFRLVISVPPSQHATSPLRVTAHASVHPTETVVTAPTPEETTTSVGISVSVPPPQHCRLPDPRSPQVMSPPTPSDTHLLVSAPKETESAYAEATVELRPSWPALFDPQHAASPASVMAHACP
jgi:hypothetical protein